MGCSATKTIQTDSVSDRSNEEEKSSQSKDAKGKSQNNSTPRKKPDKSSANNNHNSNTKPADGTSKMDAETKSPSGRRSHKPNLSPCSPLYNSNKVTSQSQTDFFKMLDEKIAQGKDYCSEDSKQDGIT